MRTLLLAAIASAGLVGCVGALDSGSGTDPTTPTGPPPGPDPSPTGQPSDTARELFNANVYPILAAQCSGCHNATAPVAGAPGFLDPTTPTQDAYKAWQTITAVPAAVGSFTTSANVLALPLSGHNGTSYTMAEQTSVTDWLAAEAAWRAGGGGTTTVDLLQQWSGCMTLTNFNTAKMADSWADQVETSEGYCNVCHVNGYMGMIATQQATDMFTALSTNRNYLITYFAVDTTVTPNAVVMNTLGFKAMSDGQVPFSSHPEFNATTNAGLTALQTFYTSTQASLTAGTCLAGTLTN